MWWWLTPVVIVGSVLVFLGIFVLLAFEVGLLKLAQ